MDYGNIDNTKPHAMSHWQPQNIVEIERNNLLRATEKICKECRFPLLALRILIHAVCDAGENGEVYISARQLAKKLGVHYDTVTKCIKFLRESGALQRTDA